ncbi:MAG: DUF401 family protein [Tissierellia bacterium]|nr:DUF401 family protein [Tissierellia bacterium]
MRELLAVILAFATIPILTKKRVPIGGSICICALLMALLAGLPFHVMGDVVQVVFTDPRRLEQYAIVLQIGVLGTLLKKYNIIDKVIEHLSGIFRDKRALLMLIPAMVGMLVVPGGAIISAPFIDRLGEGTKISKADRGIINLIFRHISMNVLPYSNGLLMVAFLLPQIDIYHFIGLNLLFILIYVVLGYLLYIRKVDGRVEEVEGSFLSHGAGALLYTAPIYTAVFLNLLFGVPFHLGMLVNLGIVFLLHPNKNYLRDALEGVNLSILLTFFGVYMIQETISKMDGLNALFVTLFQNPATILFAIVLIALFFGFTTGFHPTALGVMLPIIAALGMSYEKTLVYGHLVFIWSFLGYQFSPFHLCQLFTCEYLGVSTDEIYSGYKPYVLWLVGLTVVYTVGLLLIIQ